MHLSSSALSLSSKAELGTGCVCVCVCVCVCHSLLFCVSPRSLSDCISFSSAPLNAFTYHIITRIMLEFPASPDQFERTLSFVLRVYVRVCVCVLIG